MKSTPPQPAVFQPSAEQPAFWMGGDRITILIGGEQSGGTYTIVEAFTVPGGGPPAHIHHGESETFYALDGEITIYAGEQTIRARAGTCVHVPAGTVHHFRNEGDGPARLLLIYTPAGFEKYFVEFGTATTYDDEVPPPVTPEMLARWQTTDVDYQRQQFHLENVRPAQ
jgi:quercetin dioxygenase-like cupin family protein